MATNSALSLRTAFALSALALLVGVPPGLSAQQQGLAFDFRMGHSTLDGDWGKILTEGVDSEINLYYSMANKLRFGTGLNFVSYDLEEQFHTDEVTSGSQVGWQVSAMYPFQIGDRVFPYLEARLTWDRFRAEGKHEGFPEEDPEDPEEGENNAPRYSGWGGTGSAGVLFRIKGTFYGDVAARYGQFTTSEADLSYLDGPTVSSGSRYGFRVGVLWYLTGGGS